VVTGGRIYSAKRTRTCLQGQITEGEKMEQPVIRPVVVYHDERESNPCRITPAALMAKPGVMIRFINMENNDLHFEFPARSPFDENEFTVSSGQTQDKQIKADAVGTYPYVVHCEKTQAEGSMPIIIIYKDDAVSPI
jgi:hypothetical protein